MKTNNKTGPPSHYSSTESGGSPAWGRMQDIQTDYSNDSAGHAELLARFFTTLFDSRDQVLIVPGLDEERHMALCNDLRGHPLEIGGRETTFYHRKTGRMMPRRFLDPFSRTPGSRNARSLVALHDINRQGYGIYFAINPMSCRRRCQRTVTMARHILIESDHSGTDAQIRLLEAFGPHIVSAVSSGGKCIHLLVRIAPPRWNPRRAGWKDAARLGKGETSAPWPEYQNMAHYWIVMASMAGVRADSASARDHARVSRVPGFRHQGTGRRSTILWLNDDAAWDGRTIAGWDECEEHEINSDELDAYLASREAEVSPEDRDLLSGDDCLFPALSPFGRGRRPWWERGTGAWRDCPVTPVVLGEDLEVCETATTNVVRSITAEARTGIPASSFLDAVREFLVLSRRGLPDRHVRRNLHKVLFETARVFGWDESRMAEEWKRVIGRNPTATDKSVEDAVDDMLKAWRATPGIGIYLPDLTRLPSLNAGHRKEMESRLGSMGCADTLKASRIISMVIMPLLGTIPRQCIEGTAGVRSVELRDAANVRGASRGYRDTWAWMQSVGIATCTDSRSIPARQTRKYRINAPLVLWLCGFTTAELDWNKALNRKRCALPESQDVYPGLSSVAVGPFRVGDLSGDAWSGTGT